MSVCQATMSGNARVLLLWPPPRQIRVHLLVSYGFVVIIARFIAVAMCVLGLLTCPALGTASMAEATYISFQVPGALGTYPIWIEPESINARGEITGFYRLAARVPQGFLKYAEGRVFTFDPPPPASTGSVEGSAPEAQPVSISDFDDIV